MRLSSRSALSNGLPSAAFTRDRAVSASAFTSCCEIIFGSEVAYTLRDRYTFIVGADNILNTAPEKVRPVDFNATTSNKYVTGGAFSPNGAFWYARFKMDI